MQLSTQSLTSFKKLYFDRFGISLSDEEANERGVELLQFMNLIYKPIPKENKATEQISVQA